MIAITALITLMNGAGIGKRVRIQNTTPMISHRIRSEMRRLISMSYLTMG
jgi:hypothetical protein